jgi:hypothetical protein
MSLLSVQCLDLPRKSSTVTILQQTIQKSIVSQWVCILLYNSNSIFTHFDVHPSLVLHPRHKLKYFKTAGWEDDWIDAAETIVRDEYEQKYANQTTGGGDDENDKGLPPPKKKKKSTHLLFIQLAIH